MKIINVGFEENKIVFSIVKGLFKKNEYQESINISDINKIEKILESGGNNEFTSIIFYQDENVLYEIPAYMYTGEIPELFEEITKNLDMNNIEVIETVI